MHCAQPTAVSLYPLAWEGGGGNVGAGRGRDRCALHTAHCCIISTVGQKPTVVPPGTGRGRENVGGGIGVHCAQPTVA